MAVWSTMMVFITAISWIAQIASGDDVIGNLVMRSYARDACPDHKSRGPCLALVCIPSRLIQVRGGTELKALCMQSMQSMAPCDSPGHATDSCNITYSCNIAAIICPSSWHTHPYVHSECLLWGRLLPLANGVSSPHSLPSRGGAVSGHCFPPLPPSSSMKWCALPRRMGILRTFSEQLSKCAPPLLCTPRPGALSTHGHPQDLAQRWVPPRPRAGLCLCGRAGR